MSRKLPQSKHRCERCGETKPRYEMCISPNGRVQPICKACIVPPEGMKWCSAHKCHEPLENFGINRASPDGLAAVCKGGKRYYDDLRRAASIAARGEVQDDIEAMQCEYCPFEVQCRGETSASYRMTWKDIPPVLGNADDLPCMPISPRYPEYARVVREKRAAAKRHKAQVVRKINYVMTVGD